ncbi:MAG: very short patch repair endonuclease [Phaeospirillum sp.]|nr:very short patch repair endonuclease [Phaeospirillum sp.]
MAKTAETIPIDPERSRVMRAVKGADTGPELAVRKALWRAGLRYRLHAKALPGKPDVIFSSKRIALFVHGCFWHGHEGCSRHRIPKTRTEYWTAKIGRNQRRDIEVRLALEALGWTVLVVWECEVKGPGKLGELAEAIKATPTRRG